MKKLALVLAVIAFSFNSCDVLKQVQIPTNVPTVQPLSEKEVVAGLKDALRVGTNNAVNTLSQTGGFMNSRFKIPFPPEVQVVEQKLRQYGFGNLADQFIAKLNESAEEAVKEAAPIFGDAIMSMTFADAWGILRGPQNAATEYFRQKTSVNLYNAFKPRVQYTLDQVGLSRMWTEVMGTYNKIPMVKKVETDLPKYVTNKAMDALFVRIAEEEKNIRENPAARVTAILKKVFGS